MTMIVSRFGALLFSVFCLSFLGGGGGIRERRKKNNKKKSRIENLKILNPKRKNDFVSKLNELCVFFFFFLGREKKQLEPRIRFPASVDDKKSIYKKLPTKRRGRVVFDDALVV